MQAGEPPAVRSVSVVADEGLLRLQETALQDTQPASAWAELHFGSVGGPLQPERHGRRAAASSKRPPLSERGSGGLPGQRRLLVHGLRHCFLIRPTSC